ncbi:MAG: hypothetical protein GYA14_00665 [Ignavibacteria bacterium]|nr:hypothetical protein [Ignavibacteria bacterium]
MHSLTKLSKQIIIVCVITLLILSIPFFAMQFGNEVNWSLMDFIVAGILLSGSGLIFLFLTYNAGNKTYKIATAIAVGTALLMIWANLAVGIIGNEDNPANIMYLWVLGVGTVGAVISWFKPKGMSYALLATAIAQVIVVVIAYIEGNGETFSELRELITVNGFFIALWVISSQLFRKAAQITGNSTTE